MTSKRICVFLTSALLATGASAQTYPTRPIRFITVAAPGTVGDINISASIWKKAEGVDMIQVPYKGAVDAHKDIFGDRLTMMFAFIGSSLPHIRAVLGQAPVREKFAAIVVEPGELTGERFAAYQTAQFGRWKEIIKSLDIPKE